MQRSDCSSGSETRYEGLCPSYFPLPDAAATAATATHFHFIIVVPNILSYSSPSAFHDILCISPDFHSAGQFPVATYEHLWKRDAGLDLHWLGVEICTLKVPILSITDAEAEDLFRYFQQKNTFLLLSHHHSVDKHFFSPIDISFSWLGRAEI